MKFIINIATITTWTNSRSLLLYLPIFVFSLCDYNLIFKFARPTFYHQDELLWYSFLFGVQFNFHHILPKKTSNLLIFSIGYIMYSVFRHTHPQSPTFIPHLNSCHEISTFYISRRNNSQWNLNFDTFLAIPCIYRNDK